MSNFRLVCCFHLSLQLINLRFLFPILCSFLHCVFCTTVFPHSNIISSQIRLLKLASLICSVFRSPSSLFHYHIVFLPLYSRSFQLLYFPLFDLPFSRRSLSLSVPTAGVCTLISKLQQNCWINTDQLGNVPKEQTTYRHAINKT
jgi:hypothetical protein